MTNFEKIIMAERTRVINVDADAGVDVITECSEKDTVEPILEVGQKKPS
jgi:hypothetical protein